MRKSLILSALVGVLAVPAGAQQPTGMEAMQYYVGNWSCVGGPLTMAPSKATTTFVAEQGILRQWVSVPKQGKMKAPYSIAFAITYDSKKGRYLQTTLDNYGSWSVSVAKPWAGNTEVWTDVANSDKKLGRSQLVRTDKDTFAVTGYDTLTATRPGFKVTCKRSS